MNSPALKPCPCGKVPTDLHLEDTGQGGKWMDVCGSCCGEWRIEFRSEYLKEGNPELLALAQRAWNEAPRANEQDT